MPFQTARNASRLPAALLGMGSAMLVAPSALAVPPAGYTLNYAEEFDGNLLNESAWFYRADEKQQSIQLPGNVSVDNGELVLNLTPLDTPINGFSAAGAGVISQQRFGYGYYETRAKHGDGIDHDNDGAIDEGWHHAFWAQAAVGDENGHVLTTFPSIRRTEIDGYENGSSVNIGRLSQHVLPWSAAGNIIQRLPSDDITNLPAGAELDWHTYGFEWTPGQVNFFVDDQLTHTAVYPVEQWIHDDINLWLTGISTNFESSDQEQSEARYDYFRYYKPGDIPVANGETLQVGAASDIVVPSTALSPSGGALAGPNYESRGDPSGGVAGQVIAQDGSEVQGAGTVWGDVTLEAGSTLHVGTQADVAAAAASPTVTTEDFESFTPGVAFETGAATGLLPAWQFFDLGADNTDAAFSVTPADGLAGEPADPALTGESQMLFQTTLNTDFSREPSANGNQPTAGAIAVSNQFDTSGDVDIIEANFVFDGQGDPSGVNLDAKIAFGFRDIDNWFSFSLVAGDASGANTRIEISEIVDGVRNDRFSAAGTNNVIGAFPEDTLLYTRIVHDASTGLVSFLITNPDAGNEVLAEGYVQRDAFKFDGLAGFAVNNDAIGIDNFRVTTGAALPVLGIQTFNVDEDYTQLAGSTLALDLAHTAAHDQLAVEGAASLAGGLSITTHGYAPTPGDTFVLLTADAGLTGTFDTITGVSLGNGWSLAVAYEANRVLAAAALTGDFNRDGVVDLLDFDTLAQNFGTSSGATWAQGDANGDGVVDLLDFDALAQNFGASAPTTVPEPASLATIALGLVLTRRRRSRVA